VLNEGNVAYQQQCDVILKPKRLQFQVLSIIPNDITFFCQICEDLKTNPLIINIQRKLKCHHQVQDFSSDHAKFEFQNGFLYHNGHLYVPNGLAQLKVFQIKHNVLIVDHFGFNNTMKLVSRYY
jgi:hypothetical protein